MSVKFNIRAKASPVGQFMWAAAATTVMVPFTAEAQEYCVACTGPDALYRCVIDGARPGVASSFQVLCISALAKEGPHATCAVKRGVTVLDCNGPIKRVAIPTEGATQATAAETPATAAQPAPTPPPPQNSGAAQDDPKTVAEMLRRAKEKSDRDWEKTDSKIKSNNEKIGSFFKNSWNCLSSLFSRCSEQ